MRDALGKSTRALVLSQSNYAKSLSRVNIDKNRRDKPELPLTPEERSAAYSGLAKLGWLARNTRPELLLRVQLCLQRLSTGTVEILLEHNRLVGDAQRDAVMCAVADHAAIFIVKL